MRPAFTVALLLVACSRDEQRAAFGLRERVQRMCELAEMELEDLAKEGRQDLERGRRLSRRASARRNEVALNTSRRLRDCVELRGETPLARTLWSRTNRLREFLIFSEDPVVVTTVLNELEAIAKTTNSLPLVD